MYRYIYSLIVQGSLYRDAQSTAFILCFVFLLSAIGEAQFNPCALGGDVQSRTVGFKLDQLPDDSYDLGKSGSGNIWMFSGLQSSVYEEYLFVPARGKHHHQLFPEADYVLLYPDGTEVFYIVDQGSWSIVGEITGDTQSTQPRTTQYRIPLEGCYSSSMGHTKVYGSLFTFSSKTLGDVAVRLDVKEEGDANGKLYLPQGVYDAYRIKRSISYSYEALIQTEFSKVDYTSYLFIDKDTGELLLEVRMDTAHKIAWIRYKSTDEGIPDRLHLGESQFVLYPTMSFGDNIRVDFTNFNPGSYTLEVYNIMSKKLWSKSYSIQGDRTIKIDLSFLPKGTYIYTLMDGNMNRIVARPLAILTP